MYVYVRGPPKYDDEYLPLSSLWIRMAVTISSSEYEFTPGGEGNYNLRLLFSVKSQPRKLRSCPLGVCRTGGSSV